MRSGWNSRCQAFDTDPISSNLMFHVQVVIVMLPGIICPMVMYVSWQK